MKKETNLTSLGLALVVAAASLTASSTTQAQSAVATLSDVAVSGGFDYTILLQNTGATNLNSFWYGWTTSGNNLPSDPSGATNSLDWGNNLSGNSIKWVNSTGTALAPGQTGLFFFFSSSTPTAITTAPSSESVAYVHGITFSQGLAGDSTGIITPTVVPEPSLPALLGIGLLGLLALRSRGLPSQARPRLSWNFCRIVKS